MDLGKQPRLLRSGTLAAADSAISFPLQHFHNPLGFGSHVLGRPPKVIANFALLLTLS